MTIITLLHYALANYLCLLIFRKIVSNYCYRVIALAFIV